MKARYWIRRDMRDNSVLELSRVKIGPGMRDGESWRGGAWTPNPNALRFENGDADGDEIPEAEVPAVQQEVQQAMARARKG